MADNQLPPWRDPGENGFEDPVFFFKADGLVELVKEGMIGGGEPGWVFSQEVPGLLEVGAKLMGKDNGREITAGDLLQGNGAGIQLAEVVLVDIQSYTGYGKAPGAALEDVLYEDASCLSVTPVNIIGPLNAGLLTGIAGKEAAGAQGYGHAEAEHAGGGELHGFQHQAEGYVSATRQPLFCTLSAAPCLPVGIHGRTVPCHTFMCQGGGIVVGAVNRRQFYERGTYCMLQ